MSRVNLNDSSDEIYNKIKKAKTDSEPLPDNEKNLSSRPEAENLLGIYSSLSDQSLILVMTKGVGAALRASEKRAHLLDIARDHLVDECCQEILAPEKDHT